MTHAAAILRIPENQPELLFGGEAGEVQGLYRRLSAQWHPDRNAEPGATAVFQHINTLYAAARRRIADGAWFPPRGAVQLRAADGREYRLRYLARRPFELGELLLGRGVAAFLLGREAADLYDNAIRTIDGLRFAGEAMQEQMRPLLPAPRAAFATATQRVLVLGKDEDMVPLADLAAHLGGALEPRHVAWILSGLHHLACWLQWAGLSHGAIGPDTVFVSPRRHAVALLGGWWYAAPFGRRLAALPQRTAELLPQEVLRAGAGDPRCDPALIRATGRELLGDASGMRLARDPAVPPALAEWLCHPARGDAVGDYQAWQQVLATAFGRRRFARLDLAPEQIYPAT